MIYNTIIIGAGPAGLMAAYQLQKNNVSFLLIDKNKEVGKKLLLTGATRCNVTNNKDKQTFIEDLTLKHKKFLHSSLSSFGPKEVISFFEDNNCPLILENDFKYFPKSNKSKSIIDVLVRNITNINLNEEVKSISKTKNFTVKTSKNSYESSNLIIATGSKSFPKTGSTGDGLKFAKQFGHNVIDFYPAETSVFVSEIAKDKDVLQGVSIDKTLVKIEGHKKTFQGSLLFTHNGLSGPVIQHCSEFIYFALKSNKSNIYVNVSNKDEFELEELFNKDLHRDIYVFKILTTFLSKRFSRYILEKSGVENKKIKQLTKKELTKLIENLVRLPFKIDKVQDLDKAYVNGGGVVTKELNPKTFESKLIKGLYFIGETIDIHGPIGGYNITIALSSGYSSSMAIISSK